MQAKERYPVSQNQAGSQHNSLIKTSTTDPVSDMLSRIRNGIAVNKKEVLVPSSKLKLAIAKILVENGFLLACEEVTLGIGKMMKISIKNSHENARITEISRLSKPGRRQYIKAKDIPQVKRGRGIIIVSTSKGLMTNEDAKKASLGGELICRVY